MTSDAYSQFYVDVYRPLVSAYHGRDINAQTIQAEQAEYAADLVSFLAPDFAQVKRKTLLDIGGSTGIVAHHLAKSFSLEATVIDPAPLELDVARGLGLRTVTGFVEDYDAPSKFDVIVICQTVDHLLDIRSTLAKARKIVSENGVFFVDIVDFRAAYLRNRAVEAAVKIDHPYYLTESTMQAFLVRAGFAVRRMSYARDHLHVGFACVPAEPQPDHLPDEAETRDLFREIRAIQNSGPRT
jgi:2-polyprenyl-3-methyl-5-hydroxy-6-metoxy-1,4-benzoquinol methylase